MYEMAYERFVVDVATRTIQDAELRDRLLALVAPSGDGGDHHERIVREMERLNAGLSPEELAEVSRAALLDVIEVERAARDFYLSHVDHLHDPAVVRLFRDLAKEEEGHARLAERILVDADMRAGRLVPERLGEATRAVLMRAPPLSADEDEDLRVKRARKPT